MLTTDSFFIKRLIDAFPNLKLNINMLKKKGYDVFVINMDKNEENLKTSEGEICVIKKEKTKFQTTQ